MPSIFGQCMGGISNINTASVAVLTASQESSPGKITWCHFIQAFFENKPVEKAKKDPKRLSVERIYQKKTQLEHILLRPDSYIGSVEPVTQVRSHTALPVSLPD